MSEKGKDSAVRCPAIHFAPLLRGDLSQWSVVCGLLHLGGVGRASGAGRGRGVGVGLGVGVGVAVGVGVDVGVGVTVGVGVGARRKPW